jgi:Xaa-Pro aminopeptidase
VQFDGGCLYDGYFCDFKRMASLGEPRPEQRKYYEIAKRAEQAAIDAIRPGVTLGAVYNASQELLRHEGCSEFVDWCMKMRWTSIGHNVGLEIHEMPGVSHGNEIPLAPNMVVAIEPFVYQDGLFPLWDVPNKYGLEDMVVVTSAGHEILTAESIITRDLWVVP